MHLALSLIFIYHFYLYFITLLSHRLNSLAVCVTSWICGPQLPKRVRNSCSGIDRCVLVNCCYRRFKLPSFEKKCHLLGDGKMFPLFPRGYDPPDQPFPFAIPFFRNILGYLHTKTTFLSRKTVHTFILVLSVTFAVKKVHSVCQN